MNNIQTLAGLRKVSGCAGIEIETESPRPYVVPEIGGWTNKGDGSLRDFGIEYITRGAVEKKNISTTLKAWREGLGDLHKNLNPNSISTSVHVHVNVQEMSPLELLNYYLMSISLENLLSKYAGPDREGNLFCLRTSDAETNFSQIKSKVAKAKYQSHILSAFNIGDNRYANINPISVGRFGSLEFRIMRGTTDIKEMQVWTETLLAIKDYSKKFKDPKEILRSIKENKVDNFVKEALGTYGHEFMIPNYEKLVVPNIGYLAQMACSRKDWDIKEPEAIVPVVRARAPIPVGRNDFGEVVVRWDEQFEVVDM